HHVRLPVAVGHDVVLDLVGVVWEERLVVALAVVGWLRGRVLGLDGRPQRPQGCERQSGGLRVCGIAGSAGSTSGDLGDMAFIPALPASKRSRPAENQ